MEVSGQFHTQNMNFHENENYKPDEAVEYAYNEGQPSVQARDKEQKFFMYAKQSINCFILKLVCFF